MNSQQTAKTSTSNRTYWAQVVVLGLVVGFGLQFAQAWTNAPAGGPTLGTITGPITTSGDSQTKTGDLLLGRDLSVSRNINVAVGASFGDFVDVTKTGGLCLSNSCKKTWAEVGDEIGRVPSGAVMTFALTNCPTGWSPYAPARGRNVVGYNAAAVPFRTIGGTGGTDGSVLLTGDQVPPSSHYHNTVSNVYVDQNTCDGQDANDDCVWNATYAYTADNTNAGGETEYDLQPTNRVPNVGRSSIAIDATPGTDEVNVMDPYVVLLYCQKS